MAAKRSSYVSVEPPLLQILVVVATIQTRYCPNSLGYCALKAVVEKGSLKLANTQGLVGPKPQGKPLTLAKGNQVNIPELHALVPKAAKPTCVRVSAD